MRDKLIKGGIVITMAKGETAPATQDILVRNGHILHVGASIEAPDAEIIDATDMIVMPGFVDTHRHTWQSCARHSCADMMPQHYFGGFLPEKGPKYRPEDVKIGNLLGALSAIDSGVTTMLDWSQIQNTPEHTDAAIEGLQESGIRAVFAHGFPLTDFDTWALNSPRGHLTDIRRIREKVLGTDDALVTLAMAGRGPEMTADGVWQADLLLARELGIRSSIHMGAFPFNGEKRAITQMYEAGVLRDDLTFIHCNCCSPDEFKMMADAGVTVSLGINVEQNCQGIGDIPLDYLLANGIEPSFSGDAETLGNADMFTQMRQAIGHYRAWCGGGHSRSKDAPTSLSSADVLRFATIRGAEANGLAHKVGTIEIGKAADIIFIDSTAINLMPVSDPVAAVVHGAHAGNVDTVMVHGCLLKRHGKLLRGDISQIRAEAFASQVHILS